MLFKRTTLWVLSMIYTNLNFIKMANTCKMWSTFQTNNIISVKYGIHKIKNGHNSQHMQECEVPFKRTISYIITVAYTLTICRLNFFYETSWWFVLSFLRNSCFIISFEGWCHFCILRFLDSLFAVICHRSQFTAVCIVGSR